MSGTNLNKKISSLIYGMTFSGTNFKYKQKNHY